ncbi:response regulator [Paraburkholderia caledonica]|uniref:response regulator n=1 Tax=Paraburkholderia caledonica TaxID=134536 RepID=UPI000B400C7F|nr:hypothetical protein [Paraburkholderia caledonica]
MKVLVVDDWDLAEPLSELVRVLGHDADTAQPGPTAVDKAAAWLPDLVLLDVRRWSDDRFEICRGIRSDPRLSRCRVVAATGSFDPAIDETGLFDSVLMKPITFETLQVVLDSAWSGVSEGQSGPIDASIRSPAHPDHTIA